MKIKTSYFYQIRFFKPWQIAIATTVSDPTWFHNNRDSMYVYKDKRNVWNGFRCADLIPNKTCVGCTKGCKQKPGSCTFLTNYRKQLEQINYSEFMDNLTEFANNLVTDHEPEIIFIFYETPDNPCSERHVVKEWLQSHGLIIEEFFYDPILS